MVMIIVIQFISFIRVFAKREEPITASTNTNALKTKLK
jgi:hypothetical protein